MDFINALNIGLDLELEISKIIDDRDLKLRNILDPNDIDKKAQKRLHKLMDNFKNKNIDKKVIQDIEWYITRRFVDMTSKRLEVISGLITDKMTIKDYENAINQYLNNKR